MSFYFTIIGTKDNPLFTHEFGTSKQGGDGVSRFREEARALNPFIAHSALDVLEEMQWGTGAMYDPLAFPPTHSFQKCDFISMRDPKGLMI